MMEQVQRVLLSVAARHADKRLHVFDVQPALADGGVIKLTGRVLDAATMQTLRRALAEQARELRVDDSQVKVLRRHPPAVFAVATNLANLHVAPDRKGRGLGTMLMRHVAEWCVANHPDVPLHLWVIEGNVGALQFYRALGGEVAGRARWTSPDGHTVNDLRYAWPDVRALLERTA